MQIEEGLAQFVVLPNQRVFKASSHSLHGLSGPSVCSPRSCFPRSRRVACLLGGKKYNASSGSVDKFTPRMQCCFTPAAEDVQTNLAPPKPDRTRLDRLIPSLSSVEYMRYVLPKETCLNEAHLSYYWKTEQELGAVSLLKLKCLLFFNQVCIL